MDNRTFDAIRALVYERSGISIKPDKVALVTARVGKRMRALSLDNHKAYLERVLNDKSGVELTLLLDCISTNVTSFFREQAHFAFLADRVREWREQGCPKLRIWSAAASTGEEPYSLAMTVLDACTGAPMDIRILGTDISTRVLESCARGVYGAKQVEPVPVDFRNRYFMKTGYGEDGCYTVQQSLRKIIHFSRLNLSEVPFPMHGPFDAVFCRNVMIYFDNVVRKRLLDEIYRLCRKGGYLFVGHAETLTGVLSDFRPVAPSIYVKE